ncbi:MAG: hypothetical protein IH594_01590 [Bacteroidales bacterium]|nr:hypothetical protein [Bacteroidales bacterium]
MNKIGLPFLIFSMVFVTCERDEPASEKIPDNDTVTEAIIGPSGGNLKTASFELIIPPDAFQENCQINLHEVEEESYFRENSISKQYLIEGTPVEISKPLLVKIICSGMKLKKTPYAATLTR